MPKQVSPGFFRCSRIAASVLVLGALVVSQNTLAGDTVPVAAAPVAAAPAEPASSPPSTEAKKQWSLVENYCFKCHNTDDWAGTIAFDTMSFDDLPASADVWEKAVRKLRGRLMPPPGKPQPDNAAVASLVSFLERSLDAADVGHTLVGREGLHRLNRREYANAVEDLLGLEIDPAAFLPRDEAHDGFENIATALQVSPSFMDQYLGAAHKVAAEALGNAGARPVATTYTVQGGGTQQYHRDGLPFGTRGGAVVEHYFAADGVYQLTIADMASALWVHDMEFENTVVAMLGGKEFFRTTMVGSRT